MRKYSNRDSTKGAVIFRYMPILNVTVAAVFVFAGHKPEQSGCNTGNSPASSGVQWLPADCNYSHLMPLAALFPRDSFSCLV